MTSKDRRHHKVTATGMGRGLNACLLFQSERCVRESTLRDRWQSIDLCYNMYYGHPVASFCLTQTKVCPPLLAVVDVEPLLLLLFCM